MLNRLKTRKMLAIFQKSYETAADYPSVSQGGLGLWLGQAIDFLAGRQSCALVVRAPVVRRKRGCRLAAANLAAA